MQLIIAPSPSPSPSDYAPDPQLPDVFGAFAVLGVVGIVVGFLLSVGFTLLYIWIFYTVVWRAVRRGLREFHGAPRQG